MELFFLMNFKESDTTPTSETYTVSPTKRRISNGIQSIMSKLNLSRESSFENVEVKKAGSHAPTKIKCL